MIAFGLVLVLLGGPASAQALLEVPPLGEPMVGEVVLETETSRLGRTMRCPTCQSQSVAESQSPAAQQMRARIKELLAAGYTSEQIEDYFVARYGRWILLEPPRDGRHLLVWVAPSVVALAGGLWLASRLLRRGPGAAPPAGTPTDTHADPYREQVLRELED